MSQITIESAEKAVRKLYPKATIIGIRQQYIAGRGWETITIDREGMADYFRDIQESVSSVNLTIVTEGLQAHSFSEERSRKWNL